MADYHPLRWILNLAYAAENIARRHPRLLEAYFEALHQEAVKHRTADALSMIPTSGTDCRYMDDVILVLAVKHYTYKENIKTIHNFSEYDKNKSTSSHIQ